MAWLLTWLVHGLAIALVTRFALRALPGLSAATRYAMWWAALVLVLILPIVRGLTIDANANVNGAVVVSDGVSDGADESARAFTVSDASSASTSPSSPPWSPGEIASAFSVPPVALPRVPDWFVSIAIGLWLGIAMLGLAQIAYSVHAVRRLKASCRRMATPREADLPMWSAVRGRGRAVRVRASDCVRTAAVLGLTRPVIAVPRDAAETLTAHEIDQVVLHEYAHVQRYDDWSKLLQVLIGAFAGWHPAVRLIMREIDFEREAACDDYVVDITGAPRAYARCLTKVIEMMPGAGLDLAAVPHAFSSGSQATTRIERLLDRKRSSGRLAVMPAMAGSATLAVLAFCTVHALPIATDLPHTHIHIHESATLARDGADGAAMASADPAGNERDALIDANVAAADALVANPSAAASPRSRGLRIAAASALPIDLPFARFSPLSRLTDSSLAASRATPPTTPAGAPTPAPNDSSPATATPGLASAAASPSAGLARNDRPVDPNGTPVASKPAGTPATSTSASAADARHARKTSAANDGTNARHSASTPDLRASRDVRGARGAAPAHAETTFALGPVVGAGDSDAMPEASDAGHIGRAWENTRDATTKAVGVSARAVGSATKTAGDLGGRAIGSATKTAGDATKTATTKAAAGLKASGAQTARALGRVKRTLASVF